MAHSSHYVNGKEVPSVTTVLEVVGKPHLYRWFAKNGWEKCQQIKEESTRLGRNVHAGIEAVLGVADGPKGLSKREQKMVQTAGKWLLDTGFKALSLECKVTSEEYGYGGTFDAIGTFGSLPDLWVADWKTSNFFDETYGLQLAAYAAAWNEANGKDWEDGANRGFILRLAKDEKAKVQIESVHYSNLEEYFDAFLSALDLYTYMANEKKRLMNIEGLAGVYRRKSGEQRV